VIIVLRSVFAYPTVVGSITNRRTVELSFMRFLKTDVTGAFGATTGFRLADFAARISANVFGAAAAAPGISFCRGVEGTTVDILLILLLEI